MHGGFSKGQFAPPLASLRLETKYMKPKCIMEAPGLPWAECWSITELSWVLRGLLSLHWGLELSFDLAMTCRNPRLPVHKPRNHLKLVFLNTLFRSHLKDCSYQASSKQDILLSSWCSFLTLKAPILGQNPHLPELCSFKRWKAKGNVGKRAKQKFSKGKKGLGTHPWSPRIPIHDKRAAQ